MPGGGCPGLSLQLQELNMFGRSPGV